MYSTNTVYAVSILTVQGNFRLRVSSENITWYQLEKGIVYALAMNMVSIIAEQRPCLSLASSIPPIIVFKDNLTITILSVPGCTWALQGLEKLISWARIYFKPAKSRTMVLKRGKLVDKFCLILDDTAMSFITEKHKKSSPTRRFRSGIYQHGILPQVVWPPPVYGSPC